MFSFINTQKTQTMTLPHSSRGQSSPKKTGRLIMLKNPFYSIKSNQSLSRLLFWFLLTVLLQALFVVLLIRDRDAARKSPSQAALGALPEKECKDRKLFVYDLPPSFNDELLSNCTELDPLKSPCNALSNGGLGPRATNLAGVVPGNLTPAWYWTDVFAAEVIYHIKMLNYKCRTLNPSEATAFYVPFYPAVALWKFMGSNYTLKDRDQPGEMLLNWLRNQPYWRRQNGTDHFIVFGRLTWDFRSTNADSEWGTSLINMPPMKNIFKITVEKSPWDDSEFSIPYPTGFHPRSGSDVLEWQRYIRSRDRHTLFCFVGATHKSIPNDFRALLMDYCSSQSGSCKALDCSITECSLDGAPAVLETYLDSDFCLQPRGEGWTRKALFDCLLAGSIPVFFWGRSLQSQYWWHLPLIPEAYSVFIDHKDVRNGSVSIKSKLEEYSTEEVRKMRETVIQLLPKILYAESRTGLGNGAKDAFDITVEKVVRRFYFENLRMKQS